MAKYLEIDASVISSTEPQTVTLPDGAQFTVPVALADLAGTEQEWRKRLKDANAPVRIVDRTPSSLPASAEGTALEEAVKEEK